MVKNISKKMTMLVFGLMFVIGSLLCGFGLLQNNSAFAASNERESIVLKTNADTIAAGKTFNLTAEIDSGTTDGKWYAIDLLVECTTENAWQYMTVGKITSSTLNGTDYKNLSQKTSEGISLSFASQTANRVAAGTKVVVNIPITVSTEIEQEPGKSVKIPVFNFSLKDGNYYIATMPNGSTTENKVYVTSILTKTPTAINVRARSIICTLDSLTVGPNGNQTVYTGATLTDTMAFTSTTNAITLDMKYVKTTNSNPLQSAENAQVAVNGNTISNGQGAITVKVTAENPNYTHTYTVNVTSAYARLNAISGTSVNTSSAAKNGINANAATLENTFEQDVFVPLDSEDNPEIMSLTSSIVGNYGMNTDIAIATNGCVVINESDEEITSIASGTAFRVKKIEKEGAFITLTVTAKDGTKQEYKLNLVMVSPLAEIVDFKVETAKGDKVSYDVNQTNDKIYYFAIPASVKPVEGTEEVVTEFVGKFILELSKGATATIENVEYNAEEPLEYSALGVYKIVVTAAAGNSETYTCVLAKDTNVGGVSVTTANIAEIQTFATDFVAQRTDYTYLVDESIEALTFDFAVEEGCSWEIEGLDENNKIALEKGLNEIKINLMKDGIVASTITLNVVRGGAAPDNGGSSVVAWILFAIALAGCLGAVGYIVFTIVKKKNDGNKPTNTPEDKEKKSDKPNDKQPKEKAVKSEKKVEEKISDKAEEKSKKDEEENENQGQDLDDKPVDKPKRTKKTNTDAKE